MRKSNYLNYLNEYQKKLPFQVQKTFKHLKKQLKPNKPKNSKNKDMNLKTPHVPYLSISKRNEDKQNKHPNVQLQNAVNKKSVEKQGNSFENIDLSFGINQKNSKPLIQSKNSKNSVLSQQSERQKQIRDFQLSLKGCNFQPSHPAESLFLVQTANNKDLIVCEKCSQMFDKRTKISSIKANFKPQYSYVQLVQGYESLVRQNRNLRRIQIIEKENMNVVLATVSNYYLSLVEKLSKARQYLQMDIFSIYQKNQDYLNKMLEQNQNKMRLINEKIEQMQKSCINEIQLKQKQQPDNISAILASIGHTRIQLCSVDLNLPANILEDFQNQFRNSKFCIQLLKNEQQNQNIPADNHPFEQILQGEQENYHQTQQKTKEKQCIKSLSPDFEKQIPFNVEFSVSTTKQVNFSNKTNEIISKASSTQELLIESYRNHQQNQSFFNPQIVQSEQNPIDRKNEKQNFNFNTESSTHRAQEQKEDNCNKRNFIKELHTVNSDFDDMICDQDLTLSYSHPIYDDKPLHPKKPFKQPKKNLKNQMSPLTSSELDYKINKQQRRSNFLQGITNPSIVTASQNKLEISFELNEDLIIDGNILPLEENEPQNFEMISPVFKII